MKPGRELDALVAEKIMALMDTHMKGYHLFRGAGIVEDRDGTIAEFCQNCGKPKGYHLVPPYSTDITAAWAVDKPGWLWEFQETGHALIVTLYTSFEVLLETVRNRDFVPPEERILIRREWLDDKGRTYAWLRCLAALEAVGVEVGDGE